MNPGRRLQARQALVAALPAARTQVNALLAETFGLQYWPGQPVQPVRDVVTTWSAPYSLADDLEPLSAQHWFVERLTHVMLNVRALFHGAADERIFDPRYRCWISYSDHELRHDEEAIDRLVYQRWSSTPEADLETDDDGTPDLMKQFYFTNPQNEQQLDLVQKLQTLAARRPIAADPRTDTKADFLAKAATHFDARAAGLRSLGVSSKPKPKTDLLKHAEWAVRNRIAGELVTTIASSLSGQVPHQTVSKAINEFIDIVHQDRRPDGALSRA